MITYNYKINNYMIYKYIIFHYMIYNDIIKYSISSRNSEKFSTKMRTYFSLYLSRRSTQSANRF